MKKLLIFLVSLPLVLSGCLKEESDIFPDDSATRIAKVQKEVNDILRSAENGWQMEYYPSALKQYGGYVMFVDFKEGNKVVFASEMFKAEKTAESLYALGADTGPTINFDTYNELFHFWSNPDPDGKGLEGDYEFIILEYSKEMVKLRGKKTGNYCILTPMPADKTWEAAMTEQIEAVKAMDDSPLYAAIFPGETDPASLSKSDRTFSVTLDRGDRAEISSAPYVYTPTGIKFDKPFEIKAGVFIKTMTYDPTTEIFTDDGNSGITIVKIIPPLNVLMTFGNWYFKYSAIDTWGQNYWNAFKTKLATHSEQLYYAYMGYAEGVPGYSFCFASSDGAGLYGGTFGYTAAPVAGTENKVKMTCLMSATGNGIWYHNNAGLHNILIPVAYSSTSRTFTLTADNEQKPTWIKFTEDANPENNFTLYNTPVYLPFNP